MRAAPGLPERGGYTERPQRRRRARVFLTPRTSEPEPASMMGGRAGSGGRNFQWLFLVISTVQPACLAVLMSLRRSEHTMPRSTGRVAGTLSDGSRAPHRARLGGAGREASGQEIVARPALGSALAGCRGPESGPRRGEANECFWGSGSFRWMPHCTGARLGTFSRASDFLNSTKRGPAPGVCQREVARPGAGSCPVEDADRGCWAA